jgi:2-polyprenyl-3-methyl-5-hydroxy-6-metoxy-1,4-benzoquinol methylase
MDNKHYWENRPITKISFFDSVKMFFVRSNFGSKVLNLFLSLRIQDQCFLISELKGCQKILDIACGRGKAVFKNYDTYGIDIEGFPAGEALKNGYKQIFYYAPPNYEIKINDEFDAITIINLNAHISYDDFRKILLNGMALLKKTGPRKVILINEYDNNGFSYKIFKKSPKRFEEFVHQMEHHYLEMEESFLEKILQDTKLNLKKRKAITTHVLPYLHYHTFYIKNWYPLRFMRIFSILMDIGLSQFNNLFNFFNSKSKKYSFLVGYSFTVNDV